MVSRSFHTLSDVFFFFTSSDFFFLFFFSHRQIDSIEFAQLEQKVFEGLKAGNEVLKEIQAQMSVEEIDELMLDTQEAIAKQNVT